MKHIVLLLLSLSWVFGFEYNLKPLKITEDIYCFFGSPEEITKENGGNMVNSCFVKTVEGLHRHRCRSYATIRNASI